ncbi:hypothetical protein A2U01_0063913, partial [Trifolium medium]|nr:hypothetical protein [Trifolium medium]
GAGATRSAMVQGQFDLLVSAQRAAGAGATRSVALFFCFSFWCWRNTRAVLRDAQVC